MTIFPPGIVTRTGRNGVAGSVERQRNRARPPAGRDGGLRGLSGAIGREEASRATSRSGQIDARVARLMLVGRKGTARS